ncbi:oligoribonuclease [Diabrotica undecimpunctata]|uniref:oligoribonuclease n=1 Tax=Diabrotica undecimpunctata TaxID=50387 RepID=UPI003B638D95
MFKIVQKQLVKYSKTFHSAMVNITPPMLDLEVNRIVWVDMEMTGLNVDQDKIMEIACLVTDADLNIIAEGPDIIIHQPNSILNKMDAWCTKQHKKTGLTAACLNSKTQLEQAESEILNFVKKHVTEKMSPLAGNSVYMDRMFLIKNMPSLHNYLHYRLIDVSTVKELCRRWNSEVYKKAPSKQFTHRALSDIKESIEELKFYKENFFNLD